MRSGFKLKETTTEEKFLVPKSCQPRFWQLLQALLSKKSFALRQLRKSEGPTSQAYWDAGFDVDVLPVVVGKRRLKGYHVIVKEFHGSVRWSVFHKWTHYANWILLRRSSKGEAIMNSKYEAQTQQ
ncbi:hypothetical protein K435DRAFT_800336 [Dendrothele bispora CBS 962.96]|uniref:Uncharacterized protein n=1 Tax=Dendrothele bispora (strain CBS 962.96) TaxID=1314807 RepID=A0A4S8LT14_DENBC|nr:hypothetical protein K435DRAFT_800336 [Dendrothele bispora CBS 962.96]